MEIENLLMSTILIVDDQRANIVYLEHLLRGQGYQKLVSILDSRNIVPYLHSQEPDLILLDLHMPHMDGFAVLAVIKQVLPPDHFVPVVVLTADNSRETRLRALNEGASDFLAKPLDSVEVLNRIRNLLYSRHLHKQQRLYNSVLEQTVEARTLELRTANHELKNANASLNKAYSEILSKLSLAAEYRDDDTGEHTARVARLSYLIALQLGLSEATANLLLQAARLHDVGKIGIPDYILLKPGRLSEAEMNKMMTHCQIGARILGNSDSPLLTLARSIALTHHERWDGHGYPNQLCGEAIPIEGRIVALADLYDALSNNRSYRPAWTKDEVIALIHKEKGHSFDPQVVEAFLTVIASSDGHIFLSSQRSRASQRGSYT